MDKREKKINKRVILHVAAGGTEGTVGPAKTEKTDKQEERLTWCGAGANSGNETREPVHFHFDLIICRRRESKKRETLLVREMVLDLPPGDIVDMDHNIGCRDDPRCWC